MKLFWILLFLSIPLALCRVVGKYALIITVFIAISSKCSAQDSLQTYPVPKYILWRLIAETKQARHADTVIMARDVTISDLRNSLNKTLEVQQNQVEIIENLKEQISIQEQMLSNSTKTIGLQMKLTAEERRKKRRWRNAAYVLGLALGGIIIFNP